jgi:acetyl/propionyl-CoA carboxylase alpha subunit
LTFEIDVNGTSRAVMVERVDDAPHRFRVTMEGRARLVEAARLESDRLALILSGAGHESREIGFSDAATDGQFVVHLPSGDLTVTLNGKRLRREGTLKAGGGAQRLVAPMPGRVLRVLVAVGDAVSARQPLLVVEAMKMENELSCPRPGRVKEVAVVAGQSVEAGRLLAIVE